VIRTRTVAVLVTAVAITALAACGATTVDTSVTAPVDGTAAPPRTAAVDTDAPLTTLVLELQDELQGLDEQIVVAGDEDEATLARIDALWDAAEAQVQEDHPQLLFGFQQAITLARTGVERRRPADASKGELLLGPLVDELVAAERDAG
jgi:hypothetical protein